MDSLEFHPSRSARRRAGGQRARSPAPGLAAGGAPARREAGTGRTTRRAGLQGEHAAAVRRRPASSLVWAGAWASATTTWLGYPPKGHGRRQRRGCARRVSPDAFHPARLGGAEAQGGAPASPTQPRQPIRVVTGHELRPQGLRGEEDAALLGSSSAAPAIREIKVCSLQLVCSASHIRRATSCCSRAQGRKGQIKNLKRQ